jgi:hypothetical protein
MYEFGSRRLFAGIGGFLPDKIDTILNTKITTTECTRGKSSKDVKLISDVIHFAHVRGRGVARFLKS